MAKRNEPVATDVDDDALFAPGSWDIGPPSARRASMRPGGRSKRPPADPASAPEAAASAVVAAVAPAETAAPAEPSAPKVERAAVKPQRPAAVKSKLDRAGGSSHKRHRSLRPQAAKVERATPPAFALSADAEPFFTPLAVNAESVAPTPVRTSLPELVPAPAATAELEAVPTAMVEAVPTAALEAVPAALHEVTKEALSAADLANADEADPDSVSGARLVHPSRRPATASASFSPLVPASKPAPQRRPTFVSRLPLVSLVLSGAGLGFLLFGGRPAAEPAVSAPHAAAEVAAAPAPKPEPIRTAAPPPEAPARKLAAAAPALAPAPAKVEAQKPAPAPVAGKSTTVELSVYPLDAAVGYLGVMQKGGPPYKFEIAEGTKIAVEVARRGYGTRKVMLDGSTPKLSIGLRKARAGQ